MFCACVDRWPSAVGPDVKASMPFLPLSFLRLHLRTVGREEWKKHVESGRSNIAQKTWYDCRRATSIFDMDTQTDSWLW
jgi:hypothetical protein